MLVYSIVVKGMLLEQVLGEIDKVRAEVAAGFPKGDNFASVEIETTIETEDGQIIEL